MIFRRILLLVLAITTSLWFLSCTTPATPTPAPKTPATEPTPKTASPQPTATASAAEPTAKTSNATPTKPAAAAPQAAPEPANLKFGTVQSTTDAGVYVAIEKGYFKEQGITMEVENFRTVIDVVAPTATGQVDIGVLPVSVALLSAADRGVELKIVADKGTSTPGFEYAWMVLRKDLADSGKVKTFADLKGMKIAIPSTGSVGDQTVQVLLEQSGLTTKDVEITVLPFADQPAAFANKAIAAAYTIDPFIARGVQEGFSAKWIPNSQLFGGRLTTGTITFGPKLAKNKDLGQRFMVAYLKGIRDYMKAFTNKEGRDDIVKILIKYTTVKDAKLYDVMEMPYLNPNGMPDVKSLEAQYQWFVDKGLYKGKTTVRDILDLSFAEYAAQKLGKQ